jgi:hypothetical protein
MFIFLSTAISIPLRFSKYPYLTKNEWRKGGFDAFPFLSGLTGYRRQNAGISHLRFPQ